MTVYYSYFKKFSKFSVGGVIRGIDRKVAKSLITRFKGTIEKDNYLPKGERRIVLSNGNTILIYLGSH